LFAVTLKRMGIEVRFITPEMTEEEKNAVSHRARACEKMLEVMKESAK